MEFGKQLDAPGCSRRTKIIVTALLLLAQAAALTSQESVRVHDKLIAVKALYDGKRWEEVIAATRNAPPTPADFGLYSGLALAHLERWNEAQKVLETTLAHNPGDARVMTELAGLDYRRKDFKSAKFYLRRVLAEDPKDEYANNLLASIYFLESNLPASLRYWNRIGKPQLSDLSFEPEPPLKPILLDRAFEFSRGSVWTNSAYATTNARLTTLGTFATQRYELEANADDTFNLAFHSVEQPDWRSSPWFAAANALSGLPYQMVYADFPRLTASALQWNSTCRWDDQKRLVTSEIGGPLKDNPAWHWQMYLDYRNENWNLSSSLQPAAPSLAGVNLEKTSIGMNVQSIVSGTWSWTAGVNYSYRTLRNPQGLPPAAVPFFTSGSNIALQANLQKVLLLYPERRFTLLSNVRGEAGTFFTQPLGRYSKLQGDMSTHWFPRAQGDDYEVQARLRSGGTFGEVPLDELYVLGFDRDTDLWMRGHPGLVDGQKGGAPLGREYVLVNTELDKIVYTLPLLSFRLGPFLDTGKVYDPSGYFGSPNWMWDTGAQLKIRVLGSFQFVLGYGKDLRTGRNSFFTTVTH